VRLLKPNWGLGPREAGFLFGQIRTDASLQACAYSGRIVASFRVKRSFSSVKSGPTHRSRHALTPAESWPRSASSGLSLRSNQDRRIAPGVRLLRPNRGLVPRQAVFLFGQIRTDASLQACAYSGRIVASCRVTRSFSSVTTISDRLGARASKADSAGGGKLTYIICQEKRGTKGRLVKNLTLRGSGGDPRSLPREEKSTSPTTLMYIRYRLVTMT
jgi:hypothetical protein